MDVVELPPARIPTSRLGFGCAGLMQLPSRKDRERVLAAALDCGIVHFDVARMYGLGAAEREVGRSLGPRRDELVLATKFGIDAPSFGPLSRVQAPARALLRRYPRLRARVKRGAKEVTTGRDYTAIKAGASLRTSLAELGTDRVDLLFLHGPGPRDTIEPGLLGFLDELVADGVIRGWGVSGETDTALPVAQGFDRDVTLQLADSALQPVRSAALAGGPISSFGVLSDALPKLVAAMRQPALRAHWEAELGLDPTSAALARLLLQDAVAANPDGVVLFSTTVPERVQAAADAVREPADPTTLAVFGRLVEGLGQADRIPA